MSKICLFILVVLCSDVLALIEDDYSNIKTSGSKMKAKIGDIEREKRKEIVKNYLETLPKTQNDWVDPYDMSLPSQESKDMDNEYKPVFSDISGEVIGLNAMSKDNTEIVIKDSGKLFHNPKHQLCVLDSIYISRWLKMLILKIETDSFFKPSALVIPLNSDSLSELKTISTKTLNIGELDELVSNLISKTTVTSKETYDWANFSYDFGYGLLVLLGTGLFAYLFYILFILRPIWTIFWCIIFICIFWHWMHLYQKKVAYKHAQLASMTIPSECRKNDFSFLESIQEYFKSFFRVSDCTKYYEALMVDPIWEVSFSVAFSEALSAALFQPMYSGSKALNASAKQLLDGLSLSSTIILLGFLFLLILMFFGYRIKLPFFMGAIEPGYTQRNYVEDVKPTRTISALGGFIQKSKEIIDREDRKTSGLFKNKSYKDCSCDSPNRIKCNENVTSKYGSEEDCLCASQLTCKDCKRTPIEYHPDQVSKVGEELKSCTFCKKHVANDNSPCRRNNSCFGSDKCYNLSKISGPTELADVDQDKIVENACSACESNQLKPNICCGMSEQNT
ncbi:uncharacterized protein [Parasteatoda tepidariorum]|uniref:uncharacterized protein n=1 Tax=Parasteatoda tepidariorum TaxID=114398 RepID=UPI001C726B81|nr:uncharacterized protein LOC122269915 [Parasteatoda tepidariorum]